MKKIVFLSSFIYTLLAGQVLAEDIEIYVGTNEDNVNQANVLLMVDTSGSMDTIVSGTNETRMQQTKRALKEMLTKLPDNTKVGLGRYNDPGGSILYPVQTLTNNVNSKIIKTINSSDSDAYQENSGTTYVTGNDLRFLSGLKSVTSRVARSSDDARQCSTGTLYSSSASYLELNADSSCASYWIGNIFKNLSIPKNSKIVTSSINYRLASLSYGDADAEIFFENSVNPESFANESAKRVIDRSYITANTTIWSPITSAWIYSVVTTADFSKALQNMVNRNDWTTSSNLNVMLKKPTTGRNGTKVSFYSYDGSESWAPTLNATYYDATTGKNLVGLRFEDIQIPSGAHIVSAKLKLKASSENGSGSIRTRIESSNTVNKYTATSNNISSRTLLSDTVNTSYTNWSIDTYTDIDVTSLLQSKINNSTWCGGDNVGLVLDSFDAFQAYSFDSGSINAPALEIEFDTVPATSCSRNTIVKQISLSSDDGNERTNGNMYLNQQTLENSSKYSYIGLRFQGVNMDTKNITNLTIEDAYIEMTASESNSGTAGMRIYGEKSTNSSAFVNTKSTFTNKSKTTANVDWSMTTSHTGEVSYRSPNISSILTEIMGQSGWASGNSLTLLLQRTSGTRAFYSNDSSVSKSAKLIIKYKGNGSYTGVTVRDHLTNLIDALPAEGSTPLEGALYESALYFLGKEVDYGRSRNPSSSSTTYARSKRISSDTSYTGGKHVYPSGCSESNLSSSNCVNEYISGTPVYTSPMTESTCEVNSLIMITDGYPSGLYNGRNMDNIALNSRIRSLTSNSCNDSWSCAGVVAKYIYDTDFNTTRGGKQNIFTHVIGFAELDSEGKLTDLARKGGGMFLQATNNNELVNALTKIFNNILDINTTLASPGIAVNQNNRLEHLSDIYYSVFKPSVRKTWYGNLKKYRIDGTTSQIVDANGVPAIDPDTGFFKANTQSFWSTTPDGVEASSGGAASKLTLPRTVYTYTGSTSPRNASLTATSNIFNENNTSLTRSLFGLDNSIDNSEFTDFLRWGRGVDINDEDEDGSVVDVKNFIGDPLHSRPILLNYSPEKNIVYYSTNTGYLHAVDAETGSEVFSFIPKELLPNLYTHYLDEPGKKIYGLDSSWVALRHDHNEDGDISSTGDYMYLYGGMRMGGRNYYALDVTDTSAPKLKWVITPDSATAFQNMGQTWSEPVVTKIKLNGVEKLVLIFGGGYDTAYESSTYDGTSDSLGKQLYIVDAETGALIWWASTTGSGADYRISTMNFSIAAKPTVIDLDNDTLADVIYIGDLGGQVFKFKINNNNTGKGNLVTGKLIAQLGISDNSTSGVANRRKIYEQISATRVKRNNEKYMAVVIGTGYRSHPLNKQINDAIVVLKDKEDYYSTTPTALTVVKMGSLYDVTNQFNKDTLLTQTTASIGFKLLFKESDGSYRGEKILSEQTIYDNKILFSTYVPDGYSTRCYPVEGFSRSYQINIFDGSPANPDNIDDINNQNNTDRYSDNVLPGIAAGSKIIYTEDKVIELINTNAKELGKGGELGLKRLKWYKEPSDD